MNLLVTSVGRRSYMIEYFKTALSRDSLVHASNSDMTYAMKIADKHVISPHIYDENYIQFILDYCKENSIEAIISLFDIDLPILSKNKELFASEGIDLIISDYEVTTVCNDKWQTYTFLKEKNYNCPQTFINIEDCRAAIRTGALSFPLIIKPRWGMGSIGIFEAENEMELEIFYSKVLRTIERSYLKFESSADLKSAVLFQEKLTGQEYGIDVLNDLSGNYICSVPKIKIAMRAGETDIADVIHESELSKLAIRLSGDLNHIGNLDVDCFRNDDDIYVLELNCRFGGQYPFSHSAGVNFPKIIVDMLMKRKIELSDTQYKEIRGFKDIRLSYIPK